MTVKYIQKNAEEKKTSFNPRPYFRLFINWLLDLCSVDPVFDGANFQVCCSNLRYFWDINSFFRLMCLSGYRY